MNRTETSTTKKLRRKAARILAQYIDGLASIEDVQRIANAAREAAEADLGSMQDMFAGIDHFGYRMQTRNPFQQRFDDLGD